MRARINPSRARGTVKAPPSKSMAHRLLICSALADGVSRVRGISDCEDVRATLDCLYALGIEYERDGDDITVRGRHYNALNPRGELYARESGSTLRFLLPIAMLLGKRVDFGCAPGLRARPLGEYERICAQRGISFIKTDRGVSVDGTLGGGDYEIAGNVSSQFISGLLFALPCLGCDSRIKITPPVESRSYIDMTVSALKSFGVIAVWEDEYTLLIRAGQGYKPADVTVEGDYSGTAFLEALGTLGGEVDILGLNKDSLQGDRVYEDYFARLKDGAPTLHICDCPDLGPILFAVAAAMNGGTFLGTARLKIKESDRAEAMAQELKKLGISLTVGEDSVTVHKGVLKTPTEPLCGHNDHRIVMSLAVLATLVGGEITDAQAIAKSYPAFFTDIKALGIDVVCEES